MGKRRGESDRRLAIIEAAKKSFEEGLKDENLAEYFDVSRRTITKWKKTSTWEDAINERKEALKQTQVKVIEKVSNANADIYIDKAKSWHRSTERLLEKTESAAFLLIDLIDGALQEQADLVKNGKRTRLEAIIALRQANNTIGIFAALLKPYDSLWEKYSGINKTIEFIQANGAISADAKNIHS